MNIFKNEELEELKIKWVSPKNLDFVPGYYVVRRISGNIESFCIRHEYNFNKHYKTNTYIKEMCLIEELKQ